MSEQEHPGFAQLTQPVVSSIDHGNQPELSGLIAGYEAALHNRPLDSPAKIRAILVAREDLARYLAQAPALPNLELVTIARLDEQLQSQAVLLTDRVGATTLESWRKAIAAPAAHWWWALDDIAQTPVTSMTVFAYFLWIVAFALAIALTIQLIGSGAEYYTVATFVLTILSAGAVSTWGRRQLDVFLAHLKLKPANYPAGRLVMALATVTLLVVLTTWLPRAVAGREYENGYTAYNEKRVNSAIRHLERAVALDPTLVQAYYTLGQAYEDVLAYEKALTAYSSARQSAQQSPEHYDPATNNLARLYILHLHDYAGAIRLLDGVTTRQRREERSPDAPPPSADDMLLRYHLHKNQAWAQLELGLWAAAEADLVEAINLDPEGAAAHCLLARLKEAQQQELGATDQQRWQQLQEEALAEWDKCLGAGPDQKDVEPIWTVTARERLR